MSGVVISVNEKHMQPVISNRQNKIGILSLLAGGSLCGTLGLFSTHLLAAGYDHYRMGFKLTK